jgi:hypothetical protein
MLNRQTVNIYGVLVALVASFGSMTMAADSSVMVVPSRHTIVQLAFDIEALRGTTLIAYDKHMNTDETVLHTWDADKQAWARLTLDEYAMGAFSQGTPGEMILVGSDVDLPADILAGASQAKKVTRINTLDLVTVVNTLDKSMSFKPGEWKALAERNGLQIEDSNFERRRWGRYGPPTKAKQTQAEDVIDAQSEMDLLEAELDAETEMPIEEKGLELSPEEIPEEPTIPEVAVTPEAETAPEEKGAENIEEVKTLIAEEMDAADK